MLKFFFWIFVFFIVSVAQVPEAGAKIQPSASSTPVAHHLKETAVSLNDGSFSMIVPTQEIVGELIVNAHPVELPKLRSGSRLVSGVVDVTAETNDRQRLATMPTVRLSVTPAGSGEIQVHFWNAAGKTWKGLPTMRDGAFVTAPLPVTHTLVAAFEFAVPEIEVKKSAADRHIGIQVATDRRDLAISLPADSETTSEINIELKTDADCSALPPDGRQQTSPAFRIELRGEGLKAHPHVDLRIRVSNAEFVSQIYRCDDAKEVWRPLSTVWESETVLRASMEQKSAVVAAFSDLSIRSSGVASWYKSSRVSMGAASNDYPMNARLRVTNTANGKSAIVRVVSTGPFVPDRIIDLTLDAFKAIAHPYRDGVAAVRVQPVLSA